MVLILFDSYKRNIGYDRAKLKKVGNLYVLTWLIYVGPVTYSIYKCLMEYIVYGDVFMITLSHIAMVTQLLILTS